MRKILSSLLLMLTFFAAVAQTPATASEEDVLNELKQELFTPKVPDKSRSYISAYMKSIATELYREHFSIETMRKGEVVIATIPSDELFYPNEARLFDNAGSILDKLRKYIDRTGTYKLVIAVHSDDTGSPAYLSNLTESRVNSILDYFEGHGAAVENVVGFAIGNADPLNDNDSMADRRENRRVEFYIVPGETLIDNAKSMGRHK